MPCLKHRVCCILLVIPFLEQIWRRYQLLLDNAIFDFYLKTGNAWAVLTLGALPNLVLFFGFLKFDRDYRARGVVMATFITAIAAYVLYFN